MPDLRGMTLRCAMALRPTWGGVVMYLSGNIQTTRNDQTTWFVRSDSGETAVRGTSRSSLRLMIALCGFLLAILLACVL